MSEMVEFIRGCLDADEQTADELHDRNCSSVQEGSQYGPCDCAYPARVLAEVNAKRAILDLCAADRTLDGEIHRRYGPVLRALAQPYAGEPGWRDEWGTQ